MDIYNHLDKKIGEITDNKLLKKVRGSKHRLIKPEGWAIDKDIIDNNEITEISILDTETGINYSCPIKKFKAYAISINRGHGEQYALPMAYWDKHN